jgi:SAM-dependent methyltransferase
MIISNSYPGIIAVRCICIIFLRYHAIFDPKIFFPVDGAKPLAIADILAVVDHRRAIQLPEYSSGLLHDTLHRGGIPFAGLAKAVVHVRFSRRDEAAFDGASALDEFSDSVAPGGGIENPSDFAKFSVNYMKTGAKLIDIGCGNGRDSFFFDETGLKVTAVDSSETAIRGINEKECRILAICDNFVSAKALFCIDYDYCYARWSIHAIDAIQQHELLTNIYDALREGGMLFAEMRTVNDVKYGCGQSLGRDEFFFDGHYRRFIRPEEFSDQLQSIGFKLTYFEESDKFSVVGSDRPVLLRVVAAK